MDDLDHLLAGLDRPDDGFAHGARAHLGDEVRDHRQRHVGLDQGGADLPQGGIDIGLGQGAPAAQAVEDSGQTRL